LLLVAVVAAAVLVVVAVAFCIKPAKLLVPGLML
jgi:hypothetical protein